MMNFVTSCPLPPATLIISVKRSSAAERRSGQTGQSVSLPHYLGHTAAVSLQATGVIHQLGLMPILFTIVVFGYKVQQFHFRSLHKKYQT